MIAHPRPNSDLARWYRQRLGSGDKFVVPEIADYEVRRALILASLTESIQKLDGLKGVLSYLPLTTDAMLRAAHFWAEMRRTHIPTADDKGLDADVILAAQAKSLESDSTEVIVVTDNIGHLARMVSARRWDEIH